MSSGHSLVYQAFLKIAWDPSQSSPVLGAIQPQLPHPAARSRRSVPFPQVNTQLLVDVRLAALVPFSMSKVSVPRKDMANDAHIMAGSGGNIHW